MAYKMDESRTWSEPSTVEAGELRQLLIAVKAALEAQGDLLAPRDLTDFAPIVEPADSRWNAEGL